MLPRELVNKRNGKNPGLQLEAHNPLCWKPITAYCYTFLTNSDFNFIAPIPSILQSIS